MKSNFIRLLSIILTIAISLSLSGCDFKNDVTTPISPTYYLKYETRSVVASRDVYGFIDYDEEIPLTVRFFDEQPNVLINVFESEHYEIVGGSAFNTNDFEFDENGYLDVTFKIKVTKESDGVRFVKLRITCACGQDDCGRRFVNFIDQHYIDDTDNFAFIADSQGIILSKNHYNHEAVNQHHMKQESGYRTKE